MLKKLSLMVSAVLVLTACGSVEPAEEINGAETLEVVDLGTETSEGVAPGSCSQAAYINTGVCIKNCLRTTVPNSCTSAAYSCTAVEYMLYHTGSDGVWTPRYSYWHVRDLGTTIVCSWPESAPNSCPGFCN